MTRSPRCARSAVTVREEHAPQHARRRLQATGRHVRADAHGKRPEQALSVTVDFDDALAALREIGGKRLRGKHAPRHAPHEC